MERATVRLWLLVALLLAVTFGLYQLGRQGMIGSGQYDGESLNAQTRIWRDPTGRLGVEAAARALREGGFVAAPESDLVFGYTRDAIWLTTVISNPGSSLQERYLEVGPPRLEDVRLFLSDGRGGFREVRSGIRVPVPERVISTRQLVMPVVIAPGENLRVYVRLASRNAMLVDLRLWEPTRFLEASRHMDLLNGLQFGALLLFALYAFVVAGTLGERAYFYFGTTLLSYAAYDISILQYGYQYLWPTAADWSLRSPGVVLSVSVFSVGMLVAALLETAEQFPRWNRVLRGLTKAALLLLPLLLWGDYRFWVQLLNYLALLQLLATIAATLQAVFQGARGAWLLLGAFLLLWFTSLLRVGQIVGWLPPNILAEYSQGWSMVVGGLLMALTQADRMRRMDAERDDVRRELVLAQVNARQVAERAVAEQTRELVQARDAAEASNRAKSAFLAQLSHELRTPLHSILGYGGLLRADATDAEAQRRLDAIRRSGNHLLSLIDGLLDYARGEAGHLQLDLRGQHLRPLLESVAEEMRTLVAERRMTLELDFDASLPEALRLDGTRLRQVILNLIANACRHSQGRTVRLSARGLPAARPGRARIAITVSDDGVGIPPGERERVFEPFEQGSQADASKGMGLGLAISRQLVTLMGGEIALVPQAGGSHFVVTLDAELIDLPAPVARSLPLSPRRYAGPRRRVLVVDDDSDSRAIIAGELRRLGCEVVAVGTGEEGLARLGAEGVDLVLTDQCMSGMSGGAFLRQARGRGFRQPFLLLTALAQEVGQGDGEDFAAILAKPLEAERLATAIGRCLGLVWLEPPGPGQPPALPSERPSGALLAELREAARQGRISDIEDWVAHVREAEPAAAAFASEVLLAVRRLDLAGILAMTD